VPIVERTSGLRFNEGFGCGYSPERINPGDTEHKLTTITKVTSGSTHDVAAVAHHQLLTLEPQEWQQLLDADGVLLDLMGVMPCILQPLRL